MKLKRFSDLIVRPQRRIYEIGKSREIEGFDTETKDGYARIVAISSEYRYINNVQDVFNFLTQKRNLDKHNFFFNLSFDVEVMFKHASDVLHKLAKSTRAEFDEYKIFYIPKKFLGIQKGHRSWKYYDVMQFYESSLAKAAEKYLSIKANIEFKADRSNLFNLHSGEEIGEYCKQDAKLTKELAEIFTSTLEKIGLVPKRYYSSGHLASEFSLRYGDFPTFKDTPRSIQEAYFNAYRGGWFDTYQKGFFPNAYQYDIVSAYPYALWSFPDLRDGHWSDGICNDSNFGVVAVDYFNDSQTLQPIAINEHGHNVYFSHEIKTRLFLTLREYKKLKKYCSVIWASSFCENENVKYPYREIISKLMKVKSSASRNSMEYLTSKKILNSLYGKTMEITNKKTGKLTNFVYAAETTAFTRCQMLDFLQNSGDKIVSIITDGVISSEQLKLPKQEEGLGEIKLVRENKPIIVLQTGVSQYEGEQARTRGFSRQTDLFQLCKNVKGQHLPVELMRPTHFKEAIIQKRFDEVGIFNPIRKSVDIYSDYKRLWPDTFTASELTEHNFSSWARPIESLI